MIPGEQYGYRQGAKGDFVPVLFIRRGRGKQTRVLIRHLAEEMDSLEEWVPPQRLQVLWADVDQRRQDEANWARLIAASPPVGAGMGMAIDSTLNNVFEADAIYRDPNNGTGEITDVAAVEKVMGTSIPQHEHAYWSGDTYFVPASVVFFIAEALAARNSDRLLRLVDQEEAVWRQEEVRNYALRNGRPKQPHDFKYEEDVLSSWRYLREWAGGEDPEPWQNLVDVRAEVARLQKLLGLAIEKLEKYGHAASAKTMRSYLEGAPLPSNLKKDWGR